MARVRSENDVLEFIIDYTKENLFPPTFREIADNFFTSTSMVRVYLQNLEKKGKIELPINGGSRAIKIVGYKFVKEKKEV